MTNTWHERAVSFGHQRALVGIITSPVDVATTTAVVLVNAGVIHRVGPNRINVRLARDIAGLGLPVLRFDQSGLGDSVPRTDTTDLAQAVERDMDEAMAYLAENHGAKQFVLVGICSGARLVLRTTYRAPNIIAAVVIDPPVYKTARAVVSHFAPRLLRAKSWKNALGGRNERIRGALGRLRRRTDDDKPQQADQPTPTSTMPQRLPEWPSRDDMATALERITGNRTKMFWIYTGGSAEEQYNYRDQLRDAFPDLCATGLIDWEFMADVDHDFATEQSRIQIQRVVSEWIGRQDLLPTAAGDSPRN